MNNSHEERRRRISATLAQNNYDALLVNNPPDLRYLTGFTGSNGLLLALREGAIFFTDPRYELQASREVSCPVRVAKGPLYAAAAALAARKRLRKVACEKAYISVSDYADLSEKIKLAPITGLVEKLRAVKSEDEIALIRRSVETNSKAFEQAARAVKDGMRERDLAAFIDYRMRLAGADGTAFETIVAAGPHSALPHARPGSATIGRGLVLIDMGSMQDGYASDMTRMLHLGSVPRRTREVYKAVLEAQLAAIDAVKAGVRAARVDKVARDVLKGHGLADQFIHSTGHGLGLEIHEDPRIGRKSKTVLEKGMAITIEPGVYLDGWGGIRIEDTVVVTDTGCDVLTPTDKSLREL